MYSFSMGIHYVNIWKSQKGTSSEESSFIKDFEIEVKYWKINGQLQEARLAQSVEHETLNLRVVGSSPTLGDHNFSNHHSFWSIFV